MMERILTAAMIDGVFLCLMLLFGYFDILNYHYRLDLLLWGFRLVTLSFWHIIIQSALSKNIQ